MNINYTLLATSHFQLLLQWLEKPHVKAWWDQDIQYDLAKVEETFGKHIHDLPISGALTKLVYAYIVSINTIPVGYIQAYNPVSYADENPIDISQLPPSCGGIDMLIGDEAYIGKGLGSLILSSFWQDIVSPHFDCCLVDPDSNNLRAIRAYEKAGFRVMNQLHQPGKTFLIIGAIS